MATPHEKQEFWEKQNTFKQKFFSGQQDTTHPVNPQKELEQTDPYYGKKT